MLVSIMRYYNNAASFVFIVFSWRFFKIFLVDVESIITLKGRKGKGRELGRGGKRPYLPSPFALFSLFPTPSPPLFVPLTHATSILPMSRVRTNFWIQNSRLWPDFFQNNNFFPDSRLSNRWSIDLFLKKNHRNKAFFMMRCKRTGEIE